MFKQIKKLTALFFVAATLFSFTSCKDDEEPITEANLVGEWGWPGNHAMKGNTIAINADHTGTSNFGLRNFTWTLDGNKLVCLAEYRSEKLDLTIKSIVDGKMEVEGELQGTDINGNVTRVIDNATSTLIKTVTVQSPTLTDGIMVGTWKVVEKWGSVPHDINVTINSDHTFRRGNSDKQGNWRLEGSKFIGVIPEGDIVHGGDDDYYFTVESMATAATKVVLNVVDGMHGDREFVGTFTKNI